MGHFSMSAWVSFYLAPPNEFWHVDTTVIRLLDGTRAYLHAVIDNFSLRILAWRASERFDPGNTLSVLLAASRNVTQSEEPPTLLADGGVENFKADVDDLIESEYSDDSWL